MKMTKRRWERALPALVDSVINQRRSVCLLASVVSQEETSSTCSADRVHCLSELNGLARDELSDIDVARVFSRRVEFELSKDLDERRRTFVARLSQVFV